MTAVFRCSLLVVVSLFVAGLGCTAGQQLGEPAPGEDAGSDSGGEAAPAADGGAAPSGTIHGASFLPVSALANVANGQVSLIFSSAKDVCAATGRGAVRPGEILVQVFLGSDSVGTHASDADTVKVTQIASGCAPGQLTASYTSRATKHTVVLDQVGAQISGSLDITFADGSTFAGRFALPTCATTLDEHATCE